MCYFDTQQYAICYAEKHNYDKKAATCELNCQHFHSFVVEYE